MYCIGLEAADSAGSSEYGTLALPMHVGAGSWSNLSIGRHTWYLHGLCTRGPAGGCAHAMEGTLILCCNKLGTICSREYYDPTKTIA